MYYYGYRWYDPNLQRWPNRDPSKNTARNSLPYQRMPAPIYNYTIYVPCPGPDT